MYFWREKNEAIKMMVKHHLKPIRKAKLRKSVNTKNWQGLTAGRSEAILVMHTLNSMVPFLGVCHPCTKCTEINFSNSKKESKLEKQWKQPKYPPTGELMNGGQSIHTRKLQVAAEKMDDYFMQQLRGILTRSGEEIKLPKNTQRMTFAVV